MEEVWESLKNACDQNEKQLTELEAASKKLPTNKGAWFYLNADYLCPPEHSTGQKSSISMSNETLSFVSVIKVNPPSRLLDDPNLDPQAGHKKLVCRQESDNTINLQDQNLVEILGDPNFPESVKKFITEMKMEESKALNESDAVSFCQFLLDSDKYISESTGVHLFLKTLYPVICNPDKMFLSVLLLEKIRELANKYPVLMINGVVIPVVSRDGLEKEQLDIVNDILRGLNDDCLNSVLKGFLTAIERSDDSFVKLLTTVINRKPKLDSELSFVIVTKLHNLSGQYSSNIQFGKMLLEVIPLLNGKLTDVSLKTLKEVVEHHNTFLKMPAMRLFNDLVTI